ncbi:MAG: hypothetical protein RI929_225 [Actinomycetota bacterium]|jgi:hypothetical protein
MTAQENDLLATRYGKRAKLSKVSWRWISAIGIILMAIGVLFASMANYNPVQSQDIGFSVKDPTQVILDFELTKPIDAVAVCSVEALNEQFGQVGYKVIEIGPQETGKVRLSVSINTTELATTALVDECRLK